MMMLGWLCRPSIMAFSSDSNCRADSAVRFTSG
jgi:hypothetical protein